MFRTFLLMIGFAASALFTGSVGANAMVANVGCNQAGCLAVRDTSQVVQVQERRRSGEVRRHRRGGDGRVHRQRRGGDGRVYRHRRGGEHTITRGGRLYDGRYAGRDRYRSGRYYRYRDGRHRSRRRSSVSIGVYFPPVYAAPYYGYAAPYYGYDYGYGYDPYSFESAGVYGYPPAVVPTPYRATAYSGRLVGSRAWRRACARKYRSFNPRTGMYLAYSGHYRRCRLP